MVTLIHSENRIWANLLTVKINMKISITWQYIIALLVVIIAALLCHQLAPSLGYYFVAFIFLILVTILAIFLTTGPVLFASLLSLLVWNFFFIPPYHTLHIEKTEDILMFGMFGLVVIMNGIFTARVRRQEQRASEARFLEESDRLYKTLFNSVSHEFRIPVATILAASDALLNSSEKTEMNDALAHEIYTATVRLNRLIENLLNMSRLESGRLSPRLDWCDVSDLVYKVVNDLKEDLKVFSLKINIQDNIPLVKFDFGLMEQVLYNLLYNAIHYAPATSEISIVAGHSKGNLVIRVMDRGPGFPAEALENVFDKFYRADEKGTGGLGLGLSIVKGFTEAHKGYVVAENRPGGGAEVKICIPTETIDMNDISNSQTND